MTQGQHVQRDRRLRRIDEGLRVRPVDHDGDAPRFADNDEPAYDNTYNQQVYSYYGVAY